MCVPSNKLHCPIVCIITNQAHFYCRIVIEYTALYRIHSCFPIAHLAPPNPASRPLPRPAAHRRQRMGRLWTRRAALSSPRHYLRRRPRLVATWVRQSCCRRCEHSGGVSGPELFVVLDWVGPGLWSGTGLIGSAVYVGAPRAGSSLARGHAHDWVC